MTDDEQTLGRVRHNCMEWAMQTARPGEDVMAILARAQLYEEFISKGILPLLDGAVRTCASRDEV